MAISPSNSSPLAEPDKLDVIGELKDGGVDMLVVTTGPLDESDTTCQLLQVKLSSYLYAATHPNFANVYPAAARGPICIYVSDSHEISRRARQIIEAVAAEAQSRGVDIRVGSPVA